MQRILCSDWLPERARWSDTVRNLHETGPEAVFNVVLFVIVFTEFGFVKRVERSNYHCEKFGNKTFRALALHQRKIHPDERLTVFFSTL